MAKYFDETLENKLILADEFYSEDNNLNHFDWMKYTESERKASLAQAERDIGRFMGLTMKYKYEGYDFDEEYWTLQNIRPDYAVMAQAYFLLDNLPRTRSDSDGSRAIRTERSSKKAESTGLNVCPEAREWLRFNNVSIVEG